MFLIHKRNFKTQKFMKKFLLGAFLVLSLSIFYQVYAQETIVLDPVEISCSFNISSSGLIIIEKWTCNNGRTYTDAYLLGVYYLGTWW